MTQLKESKKKLEKDKIELEAKFRSELEFTQKEVESEQRTLEELDSRNKQEVVIKEEEYKRLVSNGQEEVKRLTQEIEKLKKEHSESIRSKEEEIFKLKEAARADELKLRAGIEEIELGHKGELRPLLSKRDELERSYEDARKKSSDELNTAQRKIESLRQLQSLKEYSSSRPCRLRGTIEYRAPRPSSGTRLNRLKGKRSRRRAILTNNS